MILLLHKEMKEITCSSDSHVSSTQSIKIKHIFLPLQYLIES